jgi:histidinol dehydrogenase
MKPDKGSNKAEPLMEIIQGFDKAKPLLTREAPFALDLSLEPEKKTGAGKPAPEQRVRQIIAEVRANGDKALFGYTKELDGVELSSLEVTKREISAAYEKVDAKLISALKLAASRIEEFHSACKQRLDFSFMAHGLGRQVRPLDRVGIYVPGGTAAYPSTVLMTTIPARVAGVKEIIVVTPPKKNGIIPAPTLVAADIAKVTRLFKLGGAQAIAALAFGTKSVPKVDKICGPGNVFVVTAKKMVYGTVDIESLAGPSEVIIVADDTANVSFCAADLIAQAEHDPMASAIMITTSSKVATSVKDKVTLKLMLEKFSDKRKRNVEIAVAALKSKGRIVIVKSLDEAIELVNLYAPEHLSLMVRDAKSYIQKIRNAGCIFIGGDCPVALGDYIAGPSHVLPTGGSARFSSPLGVEDFLKITNIISLDKAESKKLGKAAIAIAEAEGLGGHAEAIRMRLRK